MTQLTFDEAAQVGGASAWRLYAWGAELAWSIAKGGTVDYAGLAESSGTYYNMSGA